jgi:hypothetical protein
MSLSLLSMDGHTGMLEDVLTLFSFFHPVSISEAVFSSSSNVTPSTMLILHNRGRWHWDHMKLEDAIVRMQQLSLLQFSRRNESEIVVSLHAMVSEWLRIRRHPLFLRLPYSIWRITWIQQRIFTTQLGRRHYHI